MGFINTEFNKQEHNCEATVLVRLNRWRGDVDISPRRLTIRYIGINPIYVTSLTFMAGRRLRIRMPDNQELVDKASSHDALRTSAHPMNQTTLLITQIS
jgi:hypothetical protein